MTIREWLSRNIEIGALIAAFLGFWVGGIAAILSRSGCPEPDKHKAVLSVPSWPKEFDHKTLAADKDGRLVPAPVNRAMVTPDGKIIADVSYTSLTGAWFVDKYDVSCFPYESPRFISREAAEKWLTANVKCKAAWQEWVEREAQ